jgi:hypothetical protein
VCFYESDDDVHALPFPLVGGFEHGVGLANPGGITQENFQASTGAFFRLDMVQQLIRIGRLSSLFYLIQCQFSVNI